VRTLSLALYCEGNTDKHFLPKIIERTAARIIRNHATNYVDILLFPVTDVAKQGQGKDILEAAIQVYGCHVLIVHKDADHRTYEETKMQCIEPGYILVQRSRKKDICKKLVSIIPVREIEAWMIADREVLRDLLEVKERLQNLHLPKRAILVESDPDPKVTLNRVIAQAESERRRKIERKAFYESLALDVRLERLDQIPAYKNFSDELSETLRNLSIIPYST
jgi:Domain of unknown function (DUF4276)